MSNAVVLLCAGSSLRMRGEVEDKALLPLLGKPLVLYSLEAFSASECVEFLILVTRNAKQLLQIQSIINDPKLGFNFEIIGVSGGKRRQDSVVNALRAVPEGTGQVFIHDCARPLIRAETIRQLCEIAIRDKAVCLAHRIVDTVKEVEGEPGNTRLLALKDLDRSRLWGMETPQVFETSLIREAYRRTRDEEWEITDDASAAIRAGHRVTLLETPYPNPKLTVPEDIAYFEHLLSNKRKANRKSQT